MFNEKLNHTLAAFTFYWANKMSTSSKSNDVRVPWNESFIKNGSSRRFFKMASTDNNSVRKWNFLLIWPLPLNFSKHYSLRHVHIYFLFFRMYQSKQRNWEHCLTLLTQVTFCLLLSQVTIGHHVMFKDRQHCSQVTCIDCFDTQYTVSLA